MIQANTPEPDKSHSAFRCSISARAKASKVPRTSSVEDWPEGAARKRHIPCPFNNG